MKFFEIQTDEKVTNIIKIFEIEFESNINLNTNTNKKKIQT